MLLRPLLVLLCAGAVLPAADSALISIALPDLARSRTRWEESLYGQTLGDARLAGLRTHLVDQASAFGAMMGVDPLYLLAHAAGAEMQLFAPPDRGTTEPGFIVHLRGTAAAAHVEQGLPLPVAEAGAMVREPSRRMTDDGILIGSAVTEFTTPPTSTSNADLTMTWNRDLIAATVTGHLDGDDQAVARALLDFLAEGHLDIDLIDEGLHVALHLARQPAGLQRLDPAVLAKVPSDATTVFALGLDAGAWWQAHRAAIFDLIAHQQPHLDAQAIQDQADQVLTGLGIEGGLDGALAQIEGTAVIWATPGAGWFPTVAIGLPRSPVIDQLVGFAMGQMQISMPDPGDIAFITVPGAGLMGATMVAGGSAVGRDDDHWWLCTNPVTLTDMFAGAAGDWRQSAQGRRALAAASSDACWIASGASRDLLAAAIPLVAIGTSQIDGGRQARAATRAAFLLARDASSDLSWAAPRDDGFVCESRGPLAGFMLPGLSSTALIAAIAIPNLLESRITANEAAVASTLRAGIFPAQVTYAGGAYNDLDADNLGEYGFLPQLCGAKDPFTAANVNLALLGAEFADAAQTPVGGYYYKMYLPISETEMADYATVTQLIADNKLTPAAIRNMERYYICYAWPAEFDDTGRRTFAITQDMQVLTTVPEPRDGPPPWNLIVNGRAGKVGELLRNPDWSPIDP